MAALTAVLLLFAQAAQPAPAPVTLLRAAVGPSGQVRNGDYALDEERTRFDPAADKQVVAFFQWQGAPGPHRMSVLWKSPDGASSTTPPIEYAAVNRRFGGYWPLTLSAATALGTWTVEARVDGQPAGQLTFEVGSAAGAPAVKPTRQILLQGEIFKRLNRAFVLLERSNAKGRRLDPAAAVAIGHGRILTSMAAVDGADALVAVSADGKRQALDSIVAMSRARDWIVFAGGPDGDGAPVAKESDVQVGDRCFTLDSSAANTAVLADGAVSGRAASPAAGTQLISNLGSSVPGSPVFNEFGELIGVIGGAMVPGVSDLLDLMTFRAALKGAPIVPLSLVNVAPGGAPVTFADAWGRGEILHALDGREHVLSAGFAKGLLRDQSVRPADQRQEFSAIDKEFVVFVPWGPQARLKGMAALMVYDPANRLVVDSKPSKLDVRPGGPSVITTWKLPVPTQAGLYRADVLVDGTPIWRGFVRVTN